MCLLDGLHGCLLTISSGSSLLLGNLIVIVLCVIAVDSGFEAVKCTQLRVCEVDLAAAVLLDLCSDVISLPVAGRGCLYFASFELDVSEDWVVFLKGTKTCLIG